MCDFRSRAASVKHWPWFGFWHPGYEEEDEDVWRYGDYLASAYSFTWAKSQPKLMFSGPSCMVWNTVKGYMSRSDFSCDDKRFFVCQKSRKGEIL